MLLGYDKLLDDAFGVYEPIPTDTVTVARGDAMIDEEVALLSSALPGVGDAPWTQFVRASMTAPANAVSPSNALGLFEMMPRRLADLDLVRNLKRTKGKSGRTIWAGTFISPMTSAKFLNGPEVQYRVFSKSMKAYTDKVISGEIVLPEGVSLSGALAILHRCGPTGLTTWFTSKRFSATQAAFDRVNGVF